MDERMIILMANDLMHEHNLRTDGWTFKMNNNTSRVGVCKHTQKRIEVSRLMAAGLTHMQVRNTILHEIAHALVGPGLGHGITWRRKALSIGCNANVNTSVPLATQQAAAKYKVYCTGGTFLGFANRKGKRLATSICKCHKKPLVWSEQR